MLLGAGLGLLDLRAGRCLWNGDWEGFAVVFVIGIAVMQPGGSMVEVAGTTAAALVAVLGVNRFILPFLRPPGPHPGQFDDPGHPSTAEVPGRAPAGPAQA